jgi:hypothetical protein
VTAPRATRAHAIGGGVTRKCEGCTTIAVCYDNGPDDSPACIDACWLPCEPGPCECECHLPGAEPCNGLADAAQGRP